MHEFGMKNEKDKNPNSPPSFSTPPDTSRGRTRKRKIASPGFPAHSFFCRLPPSPIPILARPVLSMLFFFEPGSFGLSPGKTKGSGLAKQIFKADASRNAP
jgi:hypothetical protein